MRRSPLIVMTAVLALPALTACSDDDKAESPSAAPASGAASAPAATPSDEPTVERKERTVPDAGIVSFEVSPTGFGPFQIDETQTDLVDSELVEGLADAAGCTTGTGSTLYGAPKVFFAQNKLVVVKTTSPEAKALNGVGVGSTLADAKAKFPAGKELAGAAGVQGWQVVEEANALVFEVTGDKVTAVTSGVATSVEKNFTTGSGC